MSKSDKKDRCRCGVLKNRKMRVCPECFKKLDRMERLEMEVTSKLMKAARRHYKVRRD